MPHDGQDLTSHIDDNRVRIAIRHHPGKRAAAGHAKSSGVVGDDQICTAELGALGRQARARADPDKKMTARHGGYKLGFPISFIGIHNSPFLGSAFELTSFVVTPNNALSSKNSCAARSAKTGSLILASTSITDIPCFKHERSSSKQAWSASGFQKGPPGESNIENPRRGRRIPVGPAHRLAVSAINRPILRFSSTLVRISVTFGFHS